MSFVALENLFYKILNQGGMEFKKYKHLPDTIGLHWKMLCSNLFFLN